jgi:sugar lactone lactonase YvrE
MNIEFIKNPNKPNVLGEGLYVSHAYNLVSWVDIKSNDIFLYNFVTHEKTTFRLNFLISNIFYLDKANIILLSEIGIINFNYLNGSILFIKEMSDELKNKKFRGNDGVQISDGSFIFGSMHNQDPQKYIGNLWAFKENKLIKFGKMHIPNSFILLKDCILISDSFEKKIFRYNCETLQNEGLWADLSKFDLTPDGGCLGLDGFIYISMWGNSCLGKFDYFGVLLEKINLPVYHPTNCKVLKNKLVVTSAIDGMNSDLIQNYPMSGHTLFIKDVF